MVCVQEKIKFVIQEENMKIENLQDLINAVGMAMVDKLFTEYLMFIKAKADILDRASQDIDIDKYIVVE